MKKGLMAAPVVSEFNLLASEVSEQEQGGAFEAAARLWHSASECAKRADNATWAHCRAYRCAFLHGKNGGKQYRELMELIGMPR